MKDDKRVEDVFFETCTLRMRNLPPSTKSMLQLQISQLFFNAENPDLPPVAITPLPQPSSQTDLNTPVPFIKQQDDKVPSPSSNEYACLHLTQQPAAAQATYDNNGYRQLFSPAQIGQPTVEVVYADETSDIVATALSVAQNMQ